MFSFLDWIFNLQASYTHIHTFLLFFFTILKFLFLVYVWYFFFFMYKFQELLFFIKCRLYVFSCHTQHQSRECVQKTLFVVLSERYWTAASRSMRLIDVVFCNGFFCCCCNLLSTIFRFPFHSRHGKQKTKR